MTITGTARLPYASRASATVSSTRSSSPAGPSGRRSRPRRPSRSPPRAAEPLVLARVAVPRQQRGDRLLHDGGRLADVEARDVEAEDVDLPQQAPDRAVRDVGRADALEHEPEVVAQLLRVGVARLARERVEHVGEPAGDEAELRAQRLVLAVGAPQHARGGQLRRVALQRRLQRGGDGVRRGVREACASASTARAAGRARSGDAARACATASRPRPPGWPSMSEPAHEPKASSRPSTRTSKQRSSSSSTSGTASCSVASKKNRLRRTSSSTIGRTRRTSSVCHQRVSASRRSASSARRRERPMRGSSSPSSMRATCSWWSSTERRVASVGCAVRTSSTCSGRTAAARSAPSSRSRSAASISDSRWRTPVAS